MPNHDLRNATLITYLTIAGIFLLLLGVVCAVVTQNQDRDINTRPTITPAEAIQKLANSEVNILSTFIVNGDVTFHTVGKIYLENVEIIGKLTITVDPTATPSGIAVARVKLINVICNDLDISQLTYGSFFFEDLTVRQILYVLNVLSTPMQISFEQAPAEIHYTSESLKTQIVNQSERPLLKTKFHQHKPRP